MACLLAETPVSKPQPTRLAYLDNLRIFLTILVILHHTGQPYGPTGGFWYFTDTVKEPLLGPFFAVNASFFMGLFFLISGYFMPGSDDRKGPKAFLKDRLLRLGIPLVTLFVTVVPPLMYTSYRQMRGGTLSFWPYVWQIYLGAGARPAGLVSPSWPELQFAHLWFVENLLFYTLCYTVGRSLWRRSGTARAPRTQADAKPPGDLALLAFAVALAAVSAVVRIAYPIDRWVGFLGFLRMEPAHAPQYVTFLMAGVLAYRNGWLTSFPSGRGIRWFWTGIGLSLVHVVGRMAGWWPMVPGWLEILWECLFAVAISVGLLTLFRSRLNFQGKLGQALSANAFAASLFHLPIIVALQYAMWSVPWGGLAKFLAVGLGGVPLTFAVSHLIRSIPGVKAIL